MSNMQREQVIKTAMKYLLSIKKAQRIVVGRALIG